MIDLLAGVPTPFRRKAEEVIDNVTVLSRVRNPWVMKNMLPSVARGLVLKQGKQGKPVKMQASHAAHFDVDYRGDFPEMQKLYRKAVQLQWDADREIDWSIDVDPENPDKPILPRDLFPTERAEEQLGYRFTPREEAQFQHSVAAWTLSQFLHGEQGALYAAAQVTEAVPWFDGKLYGATQVMDEGRHVEVFLRYLDTKLGKRYAINDNLFVIIDDLMTDSRWDMKFLGMQIMVEGLALGAFGTIYHETREPLIKDIVRYVIRDEARHVHYGVLALHEYVCGELTDAERRERQDWAFELAVLMQNRFLAHEVYEEWFEGQMSRFAWNRLATESKGLMRFRQIMFRRLIPNLEYIGLFPDRLKPHYEVAGLLRFAGGRNASQLTGDDLLEDDATPLAG